MFVATRLKIILSALTLLTLPGLSRPAAFVNAYKAYQSWRAGKPYGLAANGLYHSATVVAPLVGVYNLVSNNRIIEDSPMIRPLTPAERDQLEQAAQALYPPTSHCGWSSKNLFTLVPEQVLLYMKKLSSAEGLAQLELLQEAHLLVHAPANTSGSGICITTRIPSQHEPNSPSHLAIEELIGFLEHESTHYDERHVKVLNALSSLGAGALSILNSRLLRVIHHLRPYQRNGLRLVSIFPVIAAQELTTMYLRRMAEYRADAGVLNSNSDLLVAHFLKGLEKFALSEETYQQPRDLPTRLFQQLLTSHPPTRARIKALQTARERQQRDLANPDTVGALQFQAPFAG